MPADGPIFILDANGRTTVPNTRLEFLRELLIDFEGKLSSAGLDTDRYLAPGLDRSAIESCFEQIHVTPPEELIALYQWHNGLARGLPPIEVIPDVDLASVESAISRYMYMRDGVGPGWAWQPWQLVIDDDIRGHAVRIDGPIDAPVIGSFVMEEQGFDDVEPKEQVVSIATWVTSWIYAIDLGYVTFTGTGWKRDRTKIPEFLQAGGIV